MTRLYLNESSNPKFNAQRNLSGRTHYVDDDTLRFHKSKVISARPTNQGLLFAIVTSDALDMDNRRRGFRFVIFDLFGTVIARTELANAYRTSDQATKAMWDAINALDAKTITLAAIEKNAKRHANELAELATKVSGLEL